LYISVWAAASRARPGGPRARLPRGLGGLRGRGRPGGPAGRPCRSARSPRGAPQAAAPLAPGPAGDAAGHPGGGRRAAKQACRHAFHGARRAPVRGAGRTARESPRAAYGAGSAGAACHARGGKQGRAGPTKRPTLPAARGPRP